jgi:hypothetical protein
VRVPLQDEMLLQREPDCSRAAADSNNGRLSDTRSSDSRQVMSRVMKTVFGWISKSRVHYRRGLLR